jgi:TFIIF-interacting CTD phosphatase-like protein
MLIVGMARKSIERLFPVDQSTVAVIDDRGDVWGWQSNLVKVIPYDFFVGIGDINSSFLPKQVCFLIEIMLTCSSHHLLHYPNLPLQNLQLLKNHLNLSKTHPNPSLRILPP